MNGGTDDVEAQPSDQPKNEKNNRDIPKHKNVIARGRLPDCAENLPDFAATAIPVGKAAISATVSLL